MQKVWLALLSLCLISPALYSQENMTNCASCHETQTHRWQQSDHSKAMLKASKQSIIADLTQSYTDRSNRTFSIVHEGDTFYANVQEGGIRSKVEIKKTFGHYPLQQYLVENEGGRLQVLPYSWDARPKSEGGQKWFHIYSDIVENLDSNSRYHWKQPLQNWNGMCADCHSSGLIRQYDSKTNQFDTQWREINVGCLSCHSVHEENVQPNSQKPKGHWQRMPKEKVASWVGEARHNQSMDTCFSCHSLREPLTDGFTSQGRFLDKHTPNLLELPFYYPDGQIKDEVYVYGSFQQSKMAQAGVSCLDCHDSHTMKLKTEGDALCLSCHSPQEYFSADHNRHKNGAESTECVDCHMPKTTYMGVDARRDHSFIIPNAPLSHQYQSPDVCLSCHSDKDANWSMSSFKQIYGDVPPRSVSEHHFALARAGKLGDINKLWGVINDVEFPVIKRASVLTLLPQWAEQVSGKELERYLKSEHDLMRLAAARVSVLLNDADKVRYLVPLLEDEIKSIRVAAVRQLILTPLPKQWDDAFVAAYQELYDVQELSTWRAEGLLNQAELDSVGGDFEQAEQLYHLAIERDPYFDGSYINLAELYRALGKSNQEKAAYDQAISSGIETPLFHYSFAMFLIRNGQMKESLAELPKAISHEPENSHYVFIYLLLLQKLDMSEEYYRQLKQAKKRFPNDSSIHSLRSPF